MSTRSVTVLSEVDGVVLNEAGDSLLVRFDHQNLTVHFPRELVPEDLSLPGMGVTYQIVQRPNGMRYQRFVARQVEVDRAIVNEVLEELAKIRRRTGESDDGPSGAS